MSARDDTLAHHAKVCRELDRRPPPADLRGRELQPPQTPARRQPSPAWQEKASIVDRVRGRDKVGNDLPMNSVSLTDVRSLSTPGAGVYRREIVDASGSSEFSLSINRINNLQLSLHTLGAT